MERQNLRTKVVVLVKEIIERAYAKSVDVFCLLEPFDKVIEESVHHLALKLKQVKDRDWCYDRGYGLLAFREYERAIKSFDKTLEIDPNYAPAWANKMQALNNLRKYTEAEECYEKALAIDPNFQEALNKKREWWNSLSGFQRHYLAYYDAIDGMFKSTLKIAESDPKGLFGKNYFQEEKRKKLREIDNLANLRF